MNQTFEDYTIDEIHKEYSETRDAEIQSYLLEYYFPFVNKIAVRLAEKLGWQVQPDELASFGIDGLYKAIDSFDPSMGFKFESYSNRRIKGSMIDGLRRQDMIPRSVRISADQFEKKRQRLQNECGYRLSNTEVVSMTGMDEDNFNRTYQKFIPLIFSSLDQGCPDNKFKQEHNINIIDKDAKAPGSDIFRHEFFSKLIGKDFSKNERDIVYLYYYKGYTMDRVAKNIGLSESRVSQMHKQIIDRLKVKISRNPSYFDKDVYGFIAKCKGGNIT